MKKLVVLGATGSIGTNTLDVVRRSASSFKILGLAAGGNIELLERQAREFKPRWLVMGNERKARSLQARLGRKAKVKWGQEALEEVATIPEADMVVSAIPGIAGLLPTLAAIREGKDIALAAKEILVAAGRLVTSRARKSGSMILPVDSEHSAIFQCLRGEKVKQVRRIILTASGGPFLDSSRSELKRVTPRQALSHPRWKMGDKVSLDSATLMNKGLEVLEAHWLFGLALEQIDVVIHPQSVVHGLVEMKDGSVLAQMSRPDMRLPIQYALNYPERVSPVYGEIDFYKLGSLSFSEPDWGKFPALRLAYEAGRMGGTMPAVLNAANEEAGRAFLRERIVFPEIPRAIEKVMSDHQVVKEPELNTIIQADKWARRQTKYFLKTESI